MSVALSWQPDIGAPLQFFADALGRAINGVVDMPASGAHAQRLSIVHGQVDDAPGGTSSP